MRRAALFAFALALCAHGTVALYGQQQITVGPNVNVISGSQDQFSGDPFLQRQNETAIAASTRNPDRLLAAGNDYRTIDLANDNGTGEPAAAGSLLARAGGVGLLDVLGIVGGLGLLFGLTWAWRRRVPAAPVWGWRWAPAVVGAGALVLTAGVGFTVLRSQPQLEALLDLDGDGDGGREAGQTVRTAAPGAWIGAYISNDRGRTPFAGTLVPGYPQDTSASGAVSPVHGLPEASDAVLAAGPAGRFYLGFMAFERGVTTRIAVATYRDRNDTETGNPIVYEQTRLVAQADGGSEADKPAIVADIPRAPGAAPDSCGPVYVAYTLFDNTDPTNPTGAIYVSHSTDCADTWSAPVKVSGAFARSHGAAIALDPRNGDVYVVWRHLGPNHIVMAKSTNGGVSFSVPAAINGSTPIVAFDQASVAVPYAPAFRTRAFPAVAIDGAGRIDVAWQERLLEGDASGDGTVDTADLNLVRASFGKRCGQAGFDARVDTNGDCVINVLDLATVSRNVGRTSALSAGAIVVTQSINGGASWSLRTAVDARQRCTSGPDCTVGVQVMPALSTSGGRVLLLYYEVRGGVDAAGMASGIGREVDVRVAQLDTAGRLALPSRRVSQYGTDPKTGQVYEHNYANLPMYQAGTTAFIGDYLALVPAVQMVPNTSVGSAGTSGGALPWRWATAATDTDATFQALWTDNRDVVVPGDLDFSRYAPPGLGVVSCINPGSRNANLYTAEIKPGIPIGSPQSFKELNATEFRTFVVYAENPTDEMRLFRWAIAASPQLTARFNQFALLDTAHAALPDVPALADVAPAHSRISRTVYVKLASTGADATTPFQVSVTDVTPLTGQPADPRLPAPGTVAARIATIAVFTFNGDASNPPVGNATEVHNPAVTLTATPLLGNPLLGNPLLGNPLLGNPLLGNPLLGNPLLGNPLLGNPLLGNPLLGNPLLGNPLLGNAAITDLTYRITNVGNTTSSYTSATRLTNFNDVIATNSHALQIVVFSVYQVPSFDPATCQPALAARYQIESVVSNPLLGNPLLGNPLLGNPLLGNPLLGNPLLGNASLAALQPNPLLGNISLMATPSDGASTSTKYVSIFVYHVDHDPAADSPQVQVRETSTVQAVQEQAADTGQTTLTTVVDNQGQISTSAVSANDAPSAAIGPSQLVTPGTGAQTIPNFAAAISPGGAGYAGQTVNFVLTPDNPTLFAVPPAISPTGTLTYTPAPGALGTTTVTVVLTRTGGTAGGSSDTSVTQTFTITVGTPNQAPSFLKGANQTVPEAAGPQTVANWATALDPGAPSEAGQLLDFVVSSTTPALFSVQPAVSPTGTLTYTPAPHVSGTATVQVQVHDNGGIAGGGVDTSGPQTFTITVTAVNDPPSFTKGTDQASTAGAGLQTVPGWASNIHAGPANEIGQLVDFIVTPSAPAFFSTPPAVSATGTLTYTPAANVNGVVTVTVQAHDNGGTSNGGVDTSAPQVFTITITGTGPATRNVINTNDSGPGSLRQAILDVNLNPGFTNTINFNIPGSAPFTIAPTAALPQITVPVVIDGTSQPGYAGTPLIEISGASAGSVSGLVLLGGHSTVQGLAITRWPNSGTAALQLRDTIGSNVVRANFLGITLDGTAAAGNLIGLAVHSPNNTVGGLTPADRNVISGNSANGILFYGSGAVSFPGSNATGNAVQGNYIGTNAAGTGAIPNGNGLAFAFAANGNTIGGTVPAARNIISGNTTGLFINSSTSNNLVQGNYVGLNAAGSGAIANATGISVSNASSNTIGGTAAGAGNVISGNTINGIVITGTSATSNTVQGNFVGTNPSGTAGIPNAQAGIFIFGGSSNTIGGTVAGARNIISGNASIGVSIASSGTTRTWIDVNGDFIPQCDFTNAAANGECGPGDPNAPLVLASNNTVQGNYIGTNAAGTGALPNDSGVVIQNGLGTKIGGTTPGSGNVISGNGFGVQIFNPFSTLITIQGNLIGTTVDGASSLGSTFTGVNITANVSGNLIGGTTAPARNVISASGSTGIAIAAGSRQNVVQGNYIGLNAAGTGALGNVSNGILNAGTSNTIGGTVAGAGNVISGNGSVGVSLSGTTNVVQGNFIGTSAAGTSAIANGTGVDVTGPSNTIGGTTAGSGNLISGNTNGGVSIHSATATGNFVRRNTIGVNAAGTAAIPNGTGVWILTNATGNTVGGEGQGPVAGANTISGNVGAGVRIDADGNTVVGNTIGLSSDFGTKISNGAGVTIAGSTNTIGGTPGWPAFGNVITGNTGVGITATAGTGNAVKGNMVGVNPVSSNPALRGNSGGILISGANSTTIGGATAGESNSIQFNTGAGVSVTSGTGNAILRNSILSNTGLGIDVGPLGVTPNDVGDNDSGANNLQNFPVVTTANSVSGSTTITGTLNSAASTAFVVHVYSSLACDASGNGEGELFVGSSTATTNGSGDASFSFVFPVSIPTTRVVTTTATDPAGNTSEFSQCRAVTANSAPTAVNDVAVTTTDTPVTLNPAANDTDPDNTPPSLVSSTVFTPLPALPGVNMLGIGEIAVVPASNVGYFTALGGQMGIFRLDTGQITDSTIPSGGLGTVSLVDTATSIVYFHSGTGVAAVDARLGSPTINQKILGLQLGDSTTTLVQSFAIDETHGLMYIANQTNQTTTTTLQSRVTILDVNPSSPTFHQVLDHVLIPSGNTARGIATNATTNKIYVAVNGGSAPGVYVMDGVTRAIARVTGTTAAAFAIAVNEAANLVYATSGANVDAIDGASDARLARIPLSASTSGVNERRVAIHQASGRVYVREYGYPGPSSLAIIDGNRLSPTFNTRLTELALGREDFSADADLAVDQTAGRVVATSPADLKTTIIDVATNASSTVPAPQGALNIALDQANHHAFVTVGFTLFQKVDVTTGTLVGTTVAGTEVIYPAFDSADHVLFLGRTDLTAGVDVFDQTGQIGTVSGLPHANGRFVFLARNGVTNRVYALNGGANVAGTGAALPGFVSVIDGTTRTVITNVSAGNSANQGLAIDEGTNKIYVSNTNNGASSPGGITIIDGATNATTTADISAIPLAAGQTIRSVSRLVAVNPATGKLYFGVGNSTVSFGVLDGRSTNVATPLPASITGGPIRFNTALNRVYIGGTNQFHVLDGATDAEIATLAVGAGASGNSIGGFPIDNHVAVNQSTGQVFVTDFNQNTLSVINGLTNTIVATLAVGIGPTAVAVNESTNRIYVASAWDKLLTIIDGNTMHVETSVPIPVITETLAVDEGQSRVYGVGFPLYPGVWVVADPGAPNNPLQVTSVTNGTNGVVALNPDGTVTYTPNGGFSGADSFSYMISDGHGGTAIGLVNVSVGAALGIATASLPNTQTGQQYNQAIVATGGVGPYGFSVSSGALPSGLSISPAGVISGIAIQTGAFTFTVQVADSSVPAKTASRSYAVTVTAPAPTDLAVSLTSIPSSTVAGGGVAYILHIDNLSTSPAAGVKVTLTLPPGTTFGQAIYSDGTLGAPCSHVGSTVACNIGGLNGLASVEFQVSVLADVGGVTLIADAFVESTTTDPTPGNDSATTSTLVTGAGTRRVYVANMDPSTVAALTVINPDDNSFVNLPLPTQAHDVAFSPDGTRAYVVTDADVTILDTTTTLVVGHLVVSAPLRVKVSPDGTRVYVSNGSGLVVVFDAQTNIRLALLGAGLDLNGLVVSPDGRRVFVADSASHAIRVVDTTTSLWTTISVGTFPAGVALSPRFARAYATNYSDNSVSVIDTTTDTVVATIPLALGSGPKGIAVSPDGTRAYVANFDGNTVSVINLSTNAVIASPTVTGSPRDVVVSPDGDRVFITAFNASVVRVLDTATNTVVTSISTGSSPAGVDYVRIKP